MLRKIKKGLIEAKEKVAIEFARGKSEGLEHPEQIEPFVQVRNLSK